MFSSALWFSPCIPFHHLIAHAALVAHRFWGVVGDAAQDLNLMDLNLRITDLSDLHWGLQCVCLRQAITSDSDGASLPMSDGHTGDSCSCGSRCVP